jgi:hypothetical protein
MYTYKNKETGAVINTHGKVNGANWVQVKDSKAKGKANTNPDNDNDKESDGE